MIENKLKEEISVFLAGAFQKLGIPDVIPQVDRSENPEHGDYTTNVCLVLAKQMKKNPMEIAKNFQEAVIQYQKESKNPLFKDVKIAPPGFVNLFLTEAKLISHLSQVLIVEKSTPGAKKAAARAENVPQELASINSIRSFTSKTPLQKQINGSSVGQKFRGNNAEGKKTTYDNPKRVVIEFTDPNPFKEFHIGHLYSNAVGESLSRLLEASGHLVHRVNYQGDVGMHVAKAIWGLQKKMLNDKCQMPNLEKIPLKERIKYLGQAYGLGAKAYEEDPKAKEEIKDLNYLVYIAAQGQLKKAQQWDHQVNYSQYVKADHKKLQVVSELYEKGRAWSLDYFETIYKRLGTKFEEYYFESVAGEVGAKLVRKHIQDGIFEESDGAIVYRGEKDGLHTRVFINSFGLPTYEAKDLGLAPTKYKDWPYDLSIIVTASEIYEYFKVVLAANNKINPDLATKTKHIGHGVVRLPSGKMSSRTGKIVTGEWLIDEVKKKVLELLEHNDTKYSEIERNTIAEKAAIAAIKYSMLRVGLPADITFDIEKSVNFQGDSGPYLQYTCARCMSVLRKNVVTGDTTQDNYIKLISDTVKSDNNVSFSHEERSLLRLLSYFPEIVSEAAQGLAPNILCTYLFSFASVFNLLYAKAEIRGNIHRLALTQATAEVLKHGLYLLGIETMERM